jgi:lipid-binding SYLF domain-containing protein
VFAGMDLSGGVLRPDELSSRHLYGHPVSSRDILFGKRREQMPGAARPFITALNGAPRSAASK